MLCIYMQVWMKWWSIQTLVGGFNLPLWKICSMTFSIKMESHKSYVPNHQPEEINKNALPYKHQAKLCQAPPYEFLYPAMFENSDGISTSTSKITKGGNTNNTESKKRERTNIREETKKGNTTQIGCWKAWTPVNSDTRNRNRPNDKCNLYVLVQFLPFHGAFL